MDFEKLDRIAQKCMLGRRTHIERETGFIYDHGARVSKCALELRRLITPDDSHDDALACAGMFHDVGKRIGEHGASGADITRSMLRGEITDAELDEVCRLILLHNKRGDARSDIWAQILQDADVIDHYGSVQLWINYFYYAIKGGRFMDSVKFYDDEFPEECARVRALINFGVSREIFDEKFAFVMSVVERMRVEGVGGIINPPKPQFPSA